MERREFIKKGLTGAAVTGTLSSAVCSGNRPDKEASYWEKRGGSSVQCGLCPRRCILKPGSTGVCRVRQNRDGTLFTNGYGNPCAIHVDPVEKKPLYHMTPGEKVYSVAIAGCNMRCKNCQNYTISQQNPLNTRNYTLPPEEAVDNAVNKGCSAIAYTYSEPSVWFEYMYDTAKAAKKRGLKNIWVTCGYINRQPLMDLSEYMDAANIDIKSFDDSVYGRLNAGRLQPVLDTVKRAHSQGIWVELTNLIVPEWTDDINTIRKMCVWIREEIGEGTPLHFARFHPAFKLEHLFPTPKELLEKANETAKDEGLSYVYIGNTPGVDTNTYCPECGQVLIRRRGYIIKEVNIQNSKCSKCGHTISGLWE